LSQIWNIGEVVINAMAGALDLHFASRIEIQTNRGTTHYDLVVQNCRPRLSLLWIMRKELIQHFKNLPIQSSSFYNGIKLHLISHMSECKNKYGAFQRATDTQLSETSHKEIVKTNYESTNKNKHNVRKQMLINRKRVIHCEYLQNYFC
jgi:hypothetical protein